MPTNPDELLWSSWVQRCGTGVDGNALVDENVFETETGSCSR